MPELPEIETIKLQLQKVLVGQKLVKIEIRSEKSVKSNLEGLLQQKVLKIERLGKMLFIIFANDKKLGIHLKMTGQLIYVEANTRIAGGHPTGDFVGELPSKHTRVIFYFELGTLYFNDQRKFGWMDLNPKFGEKLGPEPLTMNSSEFISIIQKSRNPVKVAIMNQELISGVGNIYANDALWESGIAPQTRSDQLTSDQLTVLFEKIKLVLSEGIKYGGATAANYVDLNGMGGHYQDHFRVYNREGKPCLKCGGVIQKINLGGRGTYFCLMCQK